MLQITKNLALPIGLALLLVWHPWGIGVAQAQAQTQTQAQAQACRHAGTTKQQSGSRLSVGSQVDGDLVTICANKKLIQALTKTIAPKPLPAKPITKPVTKTTPKPVTKTTSKPVLKPVTKPAPKPKVRSKTRVQANSSTAVFKAIKPNAWIRPANRLDPNQSASFRVDFAQRFGSAKLFGNAVVVRFRPQSATWNFGDIHLASGAIVTHSYSIPGTYLALAHVRYQVAYRLASGAWLADPDPIILASVPISVTVGANLPPQPSGSTVLITPP
jgi:hypothetical protein